MCAVSENILNLKEIYSNRSHYHQWVNNPKEYRAAKRVQDTVSVPTRIERIRTMDKFHLGVLLNDIRHEPQKYPECHMAWIDWLNGQPKGTIIGKNF